VKHVPIQFVFGDGHGDHPTVIHHSSRSLSPHGNGFWIYLGFSRRLIFNARDSYLERVFDMGRRQVPPWIFIRMTWNSQMQYVGLERNEDRRRP
jgi:hypothetical protein